MPASRVIGTIRKSFTGVRIQSKASALPAASALLFRYKNQENSPYTAIWTTRRQSSFPNDTRQRLP